VNSNWASFKMSFKVGVHASGMVALSAKRHVFAQVLDFRCIRWHSCLRKVPLYESREHRRNFLDCVKSRKPTIAPR
jgi:hypothetical protein